MIHPKSKKLPLYQSAGKEFTGFNGRHLPIVYLLAELTMELVCPKKLLQN
jgi:hypothetical protein